MKKPLLAAGLFLAGCGSDIHIDFDYLDAPPGDVSVEGNSIRLQDGIAVAVIARPIDDDEKMDWETLLELQSTDLRTFEIDRLEFDEARETRKDSDLRDGDWRFLLWGRRPGNARLEIWIDGEFEGEIPVQVNPQ
jgi:hypothetical protein